MRMWLFYFLSVALLMGAVVVMPDGAGAPIAALFSYIAGWLAAKVGDE